jgi:Bacterial SH3 domain
MTALGIESLKIILDQRRYGVRKGRCSNDPQNCTLADQKVELPYAGLDSICPECGSPLAAIAAVNASPAPPPPSRPPTAAQSDDFYAPGPEFARPEPSQYARAMNYESQSRAPGNAVMKLTQFVIFGASIALLGFFAWRMFLQPKPVDVPELATSNSGASVASQQLTQISPPQLRRVTILTEARTIPDPASGIVAQLQPGTVLDVTGLINVNGINWLRINLPNNSSQSGFIREDQLAMLGDGSVTLTPSDTGLPVPPSTLGSTKGVPPPVIGQIQVREPGTFYIATVRANIREAADAASAKLGGFEFGETLVVVAQRSVGDSVWYQVELPSGGTGWINSRLVSNTPRDIPLDRQSASPVAPSAKAPAKPGTTGDQPSSEVGKSDNQEALSAYSNGTTLRVDAPTANLRKEPGPTGNNVVEALGRDTLMSVEDVRIVNGVPWYRVTSPSGVKGWVSGRTVVENR